MGPRAMAFALLAPLAFAAPSGLEDKIEKRLTIKTSVQNLGLTTSTLPNIYRDGGGGGKVNGLNLMMFSDGIYTSDGRPPKGDLSNWRNFTSNSIAVSGYQGNPITVLTDFGDTDKGPRQQIPFFYHAGEDDSKTGIWPSQIMVTLCNGTCGVSFPEVINRTAPTSGEIGLYNTPVIVSLTAFGPIASRPVQAHFKVGEPLFGTFSALLDKDGYLYTFAKIEGTQNSNGLKVARVLEASWYDRNEYQYWNGNAWTTAIPKYDDGGVANIFKYSQSWDGKTYGPGYGEVFFSPVYNAYILLFQPEDSGVDNNVYMSYSTSITSGWSSPVSIFQMPVFSDGYSYAFHAYPNYDSTGRTIPISWTQYSTANSYFIAMANITFS